MKKMKNLTKCELERLRQIRKALHRFKREGRDVSTWEATFFLAIIRKLTGK